MKNGALASTRSAALAEFRGTEGLIPQDNTGRETYRGRSDFKRPGTPVSPETVMRKFVSSSQFKWKTLQNSIKMPYIA